MQKKELGKIANCKKLVLLTDKLRMQDEITYQHSIRAAAYAVACGRALALSPDKVRHLYYGMLLHDIGKIKIPPDLLYKKEPLAEAEKEEIRRHTEAGCSIVAEYNPPQDVRNVILYHHERWDGSGYPKGLCGEEIPLPARIAAVADTYEAMTSDRPYRKGISHKAAVEEIQSLAGKKFDPHIVHVFCNAIEEKLKRWENIWTFGS
ncbi:MAG: HD-GYP domain-containing protein [Clostridia bacterium]